MGASAVASVARASASASATASGARAAPVVSGLPAYMSVVDAGAGAGAAQGRIEALQQQEQTDDRSVAEDLADRIGQSDARETMQAEDARQAARSDTAQQGQEASRQAAQAGSDAVSRASQPEDAASHADDGGGLVGPDGTSAQPGDGQASRADDGAQAGGAGEAGGAGADGGGVGGGVAGGAPTPGAPGGASGTAGAGAATAGAEGPATGAAGAQGSGAGAGAAANGPLADDVPRDGAAAAPDTGAGALGTGDLVLIDVELAEHQRWAAAESVVGEAGSMQRAEFIAQSAGGGFIGGVASGAAMGLGIGLISRAVPVLGPIIGGGMALHGLITRDWAATGATIGKFGEGSDTYDTLANTLASVSAVIDVVNGVLDTIGGIVGVVEAVAIGVAAGAGVLAFFTFGATAGIAVAAGELAADCEEIREGISAVTTVLNEINNELLNPCILLFRALHEFTADADPREIESGGHDLAGAAGAIGGALGGWLGGHAANVGAHPPPQDGEGTTQRPPHETPPAAAGDGPEVHFQEPPTAPPATPSAGESLPRPASPEPEAAPRARRIADDQTPGPMPDPASQATSPAPAAPQGPDATQLPLGGVDMTPQRPPPRPELPSRITPDVEIRGKFRDSDMSVRPDRADGSARAGDIAPHRLQGTRGSDLISEHVIPGAQLRDGTIDPAHGNAPDWVRTTPNEADGRDYNNAPTIVEHAAVSARKTTLDNAETARLKAVGGPRDPVTDELLPSLARHQQAVDEAIAAGEITPEQATDPVQRALVAQAEMWSRSESVGGAKARDDAANGGPRVTQPRRPDRQRAQERRRIQERLAGEHIEDIDWGATFNQPDPNMVAAPVGTQFDLYGAPTPPTSTHASPEQLDLPHTGGPAVPRSQLELPHDQNAKTSPDRPRRVGEASVRSSEPLTPEQYQAAVAMAVEMGMPADQITQSRMHTLYMENYDTLSIGADLHPLPASQRPADLVNPANAALEARAVIGHEVIGHREAALGGATREDEWHEELQASARAALHTPGLSREQSWLLLQDAAARRRFQTREGEIYIDTERYGPAAEAQRAPAAPRGPGDEPSVIIDPSLYDAEPAAAAVSSPASSTPPSEETAAAVTPAAPAGAGAGSSAHAAAGYGARAHQVAALFLPQVFGGGGEAPTYAQQQAAHRAEFTDDNQPAAGVERVNPHYSSPPGTPDQIVALQNEILNLLAVRARAEAESQHEGERIDACEDNRAPIAATLADTRGGLGAVRAHEQAVQRRDAANQAQQQRQQESEGLTSGYPDKATGLTVLEVPLAAWEGFTSLASHLPGSAGDRMSEMNGEARRMQDAFAQMGNHMAGADGAQPARAAALTDDSARIAATGEQAQSSHEELQTAADGAVGLQSANDATLAAAQQRRQAADQRSAELQSAADDRQAAADSLAAQMQAWAQAHRDERSQAIAATAARLQGEGKIVTESSPE